MKIDIGRHLVSRIFLAPEDGQTSTSQVFERLMSGRTSIVVAHRLSTVRRADRIAVVDGGELVELGDHDELVELGGRYAALAAAWDAGQPV